MLGAICRIIGTDIVDAVVVGKRSYVGHVDRYTLRYQVNGVPYEQEFSKHEIIFGYDAADNVVALTRA